MPPSGSVRRPRPRFALLASSWWILAAGCVAVDGGPTDGGATRPPDASPPDASPPDADAGAAPLPDCTFDGAWVRALRGRDARVRSVLVAPGVPWTELRTALASSTAPALAPVLGTIRAQATRPSPTLAPGGTPVYQSLASHALAAAWVGFTDDDPGMRATALADLETAGVEASFWSGAPEVTIRVGASLVALAGAVDLLSGSDPAMGPPAQAALVRALDAVVAWYRSEGELLSATHSDNFTMRLGAGIVSAAMLTPPEPAGDALLAIHLAAMARTLDATQTDGRGLWREGPFYLAYGMEVAPLAWAALDAAWEGPDARCVTCPDELLAACARQSVMVVRPSRDPVLPLLVAWLGHLEGHGGLLVPFDDARPVAWVPAPFERLAGVRSARAWTPALPNALGGSVQVGPFVAAALARDDSALPWSARETVSGGVAHLEGATDSGPILDAFLVAEDAFSARGGGHERPDPLSLTVMVDGALMLGPGGYESYAARALYNAGSQSSLVTIDGLVPAGSSAAAVAGATIAATPGGATAVLGAEGITWTRTVALDAGVLTVRDVVHLDDTREVIWHWHTRGTLGADGLSWTLGTASCAIAFEGAPSPVRTEQAPHSDDGRSGATHAVLRFGGALGAGDHVVSTRLVCASP